MFEQAELFVGLAGACIACVFAILFFRGKRDIAALKQQLSTACADAENWRTKESAEREARIGMDSRMSQLDKCESALVVAQSEVLRLTQTSSAFEGQCKRIPELEVEVATLSARIIELSTISANLEATLREQEKSHHSKVEALQAIRGEIEKDFKNIASESLKANETSFLHLANEVFEKHKEIASTEIEAKTKVMDSLVTPIVEMLNSYQQQITETEKSRLESYGALSSELKAVVETQHSVRAETAKLVNALRAAPKTRGRWGEHTLRNVLELAGLSAYCDFSVEKTIHNDTGSIRPDVIIRLPGERTLVVDAKTSLSAYLDAVECTEEGERERHLDLHAMQIRNHVKQLGAKAYWEGLGGTPDFVVMFVPGDNFYSAAAERDQSLFEFAAAQRVLIVTPATLIALAKAVAYGWRQEKIAENTKAVHELGRDLHRRLSTMGEHIVGVGKNLSASVRKYNEFIGSLETSVMPQARKFNELEVEGTSTAIPAISLIDTDVRELSKARDIILPEITQAALGAGS